MTDSSDKEVVLAANVDFYRAFSNQDLSSMSLLWWQGSTSLCIHPGSQVLMGWEEIRASWESIFRNTDSMEIDIEVIKIEIDQALAYVIVREIVLQSSRGRKLKAQSMATNLFQKMAQKWYLVHHHGSPIMR
ncbi:MAG: nuclear transport factor 2 family protein [Symploca sp. SIO1C4]|uniref:Nuclear transport factor 2 family protein n=1 Tax=Symploca sp. SIO1C4 TaxID=2607765 RepID=A0A6B3N5P5_9CYAN|nr:nuclear transport factor 2 family protein [Symploca sp. SIO1C4]